MKAERPDEAVGDDERRKGVYRSCIWVSASNKASQVVVNSYDITAVRIEIEGRTFVMMSVYIPTVSEGRAAMEERLKAIDEAMARQKMVNPAVEFIVGGNFNRQDALWGGKHVADTARQGEGERTIQLMLENDLQSLLPQGTVTWESRGLKSTIDLSLSTSRLAEERIRCMIWPNHYGSDHSHIHTTYSIKRPEPAKTNRLLFKEADWDKIRAHISALKRSNLCPTNLDMAAQWLQDTVSNTLVEYCPRSKPSPYAKRWWNGDLTSMRRSYTAARDRASKLDSQGRSSDVAQRETVAARASFHREIKRAKRDHWNSFFEEPTNVWKVAKYLDADGNGRASFSPIPNFIITDPSGTVREVSDDSAIADELLRSFFPPTVQPASNTLLPPAQQQLPWEPLQKRE